MKKYFFVYLVLVVFLVSCGTSKRETTNNKSKTNSVQDKVNKQINEEEKIVANQELIKKLNVHINKTGFTSSYECGKCHLAIFDKWKNSMHALSLKDPIFDVAYQQAIKLEGEPARQLCLNCHSPIAVLNKDYFLKEQISNEGISCDFCHSINAIDNQTLKFTVLPSLIKYGSYAKADSPVHNTQYKELFKKSDFCKGCHQFKNKQGLVIFGTYSEWKSSKFAKEKQCQDCHMPISNENIVAKSIKNIKQKINLHNIQGGHSIEQLKKATEVKIENVKNEKGKYIVNVSVINKGSGHMIPTGIPTRKLVLTILVTDKNGNKIYTNEIVFNKLIADEKGKILNNDAEVILYGSKVLKDNRIAPGEERNVYFNFYSQKTNFYAEAKLTYKYKSNLISQQILFELDKDKVEYK